jgi:hypothetical protein
VWGCTDSPTHELTEEEDTVSRLLTSRHYRVVVVPLVAAALASGAPAVSAAGDANPAACPNSGMAGFRSYLPDCRAYELVTPPYKAGSFIDAYPPSINDSGTELIGDSLANFAEVPPKTLNFLLPYKMSRTGAGWTTAPVLTTTTALARAGKAVYASLLRHVDPGAHMTLWDVFYVPSSGTGEPEDVFEIGKPDGSFVEVGPVHPGQVQWGSGALAGGPDFVAASRSMQHIYFYAESRGNPGETWPGDTTPGGSSSLYEYSGTGQPEPRLVGVKNQHRLLHNTEAEPVSQCGTILGASFGEKYNAVASGGTTAFFTALQGQPGTCAGPPADELYARLNGERTIAISEPSPQDCEACNIASGIGAAKFQGASADGRNVYFLTSQELLPGAKGTNLYAYDFGGPPGQKISLVSSGAPEALVQGVVRVSQDGSRVYFVAAGKLTGPNREGKEPQAGADNLYLFQRGSQSEAGRLAFVATLDGSDESVWEEPDFSRPAAATPDGNFLVFTSSADLTAGDTSTQPQLFEYDAAAETLTRISSGQRSAGAGYNEDGNTTNEIDKVTIATPGYGTLNVAAGEVIRSLSNDGKYIFFQTPLGLAPEASNNVKVGRACVVGVENEAGECSFGEQPVYAQNVYEYHWTNRVADGNTYLISGGRDGSAFREGEAVHLWGTDAEGRDVFFSTTESLVPSDTDTQEDIYDARVGGGFPHATGPGGCGSSSCERPSSGSPQLLAPGSAEVTGEPNGTPTVAPMSTSRPLSRKQRLAIALRACRKKAKPRRHRCEAVARRRLGLRSATNETRTHERPRGQR